ncbi:MAG: hypothetical protein H0V66_07205, partial [Bdellovibrionales bacterium]|nr:hypothetical protein [Bdellovibrionales bacterium]
MKVYTNINQILTLAPAHSKDGRKLKPEDLGIINDGAVVFNEKSILWIGPTAELPDQYKSIKFKSLQGHVLTPELVDSHT